MNSLSLPNRAFLENVLGMSGGYVLDFSNASFETFFAELNIPIYDNNRYPNESASGSKANRLRAFWKTATNEEIATSLDALADYIEAEKEAPAIWGIPKFPDITAGHITRLRDIVQSIKTNKTLQVNSTTIGFQSSPIAVETEATVTDDKIQIEIHADIYNHIKQYLDSKDYFHAVEESYKLVREKLKDITGEEQASEAFNMNAESKKYLSKLFGKPDGETQAEKDFFRGVGYLHLTIQFLRNEKAHTPATPLEPNLAIHYISLASLAYDLITRYLNPEDTMAIENAIKEVRLSYGNVDSFYNDFRDGKWLKSFTPPVSISTSTQRLLKSKWLSETDFTVSYNHSNVALMRLALIADMLTVSDIESLLNMSTKDKYGNDQLAGLLEFLQYIKQAHPDKTSQTIDAWITEYTNE